MKWSTLGRQNGGPSSYEELNKFFSSKTVRIIALTVVITIPLLAIFVILVLLYRKKRIIPTLKILVCISTGASLLLVNFVSSWAEAHQMLIIQNGTVTIPTKVYVGFRSGLQNVIVYMECPGAHHPDYFEKEIKLGNRMKLHNQYVSALGYGWAWPLLFMASLLGGENLIWDGLLGECLYKASQVAEPCVIASVYLWFLWCISFKIAPRKNFQAMTSLGISLLLSAALFCFVILSCPKIYLSDGQELVLEIGWCTELTAGLGFCFCIVGLGGYCTRRKEVKVPRYESFVIKDSRSLCNGNVYSFPNSQPNNNTENILNANEVDNSNVYDNRNGKSLSPTILSNMFVQ